MTILGSLVGCAGQHPPVAEQPVPVIPTEPVPAIRPLPDGEPPSALRPTGRGRWVRAPWSDLPGWSADRVQQAWPALLRSCERHAAVTAQALLAGAPAAAPVTSAPSAPTTAPALPPPMAVAPQPPSPPAVPTPTALQVAATWAPACSAARALGADADETLVRRFLQQRLQPWRVETAEGRTEGLLTGYFEPLLEASRQRTERHAVPLHAPPADLAQRRPWYTRAQADSLPAAQAALRGREIAWVVDPLDALLVQIQGSGRLVIGHGAERTVSRLAFAGHNDQPYQSIGRWLVEQGAFTLEQANWPAIRTWARANPQRVREMLNVNPRLVFFREEALADPAVGAVGAQGVPLTPGRSIAVDRDSIPYGTPVWLASTEPQPWSPNPPPARPLQRLVVAQDTGSAITGAVRADLFWGWGEGIEERAGRTKQPLRLWALWPR